jgi:hypothetical protein
MLSRHLQGYVSARVRDLALTSLGAHFFLSAHVDFLSVDYFGDDIRSRAEGQFEKAFPAAGI